MNGTSKELVEVLKDSTSISSIFNGTELVWEKHKEPINPYKGKFAGRFSSSSSFSNWFCYIGGAYNSNNKVQLTQTFNKNTVLSGSIRALFFEASALEEVYNIAITDKVTNTREAFYYCTNLTAIHADDWNMINVTDASNMFDGCTKLTTITGTISGIKAALNLGNAPLTNESAMIFINGLEPTATAKTIKFKAVTYNTLTEDQIAVATSKGWTVAKY